MADDGEKKPKKDMGKILGLVFMLLNFVVLGAGAFLVYSSTIGYTPPQVSNEDLNKEIEEFRKSLQGKPIVYTMETFNTNLRGVPRRYVRMQVNLELLNEEGYEEVIGLGAEARDSIVKILNGKKFHEIESVQGKLHLKNQISESLNSFLEKGVVKNVYFSKFAVQ